jgi:hypothetical protein
MGEVETVSGVAVNADCGVVDDQDLRCAMRQRREATERTKDVRRCCWRKMRSFRFLAAFGKERFRAGISLADDVQW